MSSGAETAWSGLEPEWQRAIELAWRSWAEGNFGIGAVLVDADGTVVSEGRNQVSMTDSDQPLAGNFMAHAEMNAFASMSSFTARGLTVVTTLEPCVMCGATCLFLRAERVRYAAVDEFYDRLDETLWAQHPHTAERMPPVVCDLDERLGLFCRLLPLAFTLEFFSDRGAARVGRERRPALSALAEAAAVGPLREVAASGGSVADALALIGPALDAVDDPPLR